MTLSCLWIICSELFQNIMKTQNIPLVFTFPKLKWKKKKKDSKPFSPSQFCPRIRKLEKGDGMHLMTFTVEWPLISPLHHTRTCWRPQKTVMIQHISDSKRKPQSKQPWYLGIRFCWTPPLKFNSVKKNKKKKHPLVCHHLVCRGLSRLNLNCNIRISIFLLGVFFFFSFWQYLM